jgi:hypothetical protein
MRPIPWSRAYYTTFPIHDAEQHAAKLWYNTLLVKVNREKRRSPWRRLSAAVAALAIVLAALVLAMPLALLYAPLPALDFDASPYLGKSASKLVADKRVTARLKVRRGDGVGLRMDATGRILGWPFAARAGVRFGFVRADGDFALSLTDTEWRMSGTFDIRSRKSWRFSANVPETKFSSEDDVVGRILSNLELSSVSNIACTGSFSLSAHGECTPKLPVASWSARAELKEVSASLTAGKAPVSMENLRVAFGATGIAGRTDIMPMFPRADSIEAAGVVLSNVFASVRATERSYLVTEAGADCAGGELRLYSLFLDPQRLSAGATIYVDGVDAGEVLAHVSGFRGEATGRLHGKMPFFLKDGRELRFRDAYLFSTPGETGRVRVADPGPILDNLAIGGVPKDTRDNLAKALGNLDYTVLRVVLRRGDEVGDSSLSLMLRGSATSGKTTVPVNLDVTFRGDLDQLVDTGMKFTRR